MNKKKIEPAVFFPSIGEYPVYDELLYYAMTQDEKRIIRYKNATDKVVKGKKVVDIGTGKDAILARLCVESGAAFVYAIEMDKEAFEQATLLIKKLNLEDKIKVIFGNALEVSLPQQVDVCISEIIGTIGGSEGAAMILNNAQRFLSAGGRMIPERCVTRIAAISLPENIYHTPFFDELGYYYANKVFETMNASFEIRLCIKNMPQTIIISTDAIVEDLHFNMHNDENYANDFELKIIMDSRLDGVALWINLFTIDDHMVDSLAEETNWLPVYFPLFDKDISVAAGDIIKGKFTVSLSENGVNPDYKLEGLLIRNSGQHENFEFNSFFLPKTSEKNNFYNKLFLNTKNMF